MRNRILALAAVAALVLAAWAAGHAHHRSTRLAGDDTPTAERSSWG
jgi:hypothetical protein